MLENVLQVLDLLGREVRRELWRLQLFSELRLQFLDLLQRRVQQSRVFLGLHLIHGPPPSFQRD